MGQRVVEAKRAKLQEASDAIIHCYKLAAGVRPESQEQIIQSKVDELIQMVKDEVNAYHSYDDLMETIVAKAIPVGDYFFSKTQSRIELIMPSDILLTMKGIKDSFLDELARRRILLTNPSQQPPQLRLKGYARRIRAHRLDVEAILDAT